MPIRCKPMVTGPDHGEDRSSRSMLVGASCGALVALPALILAFISAGAGHGDYVSARLLFPFPMLLTLVEGRIGWLSLGVALIQFPLYGGLLGRAISRKTCGIAVSAAALHLFAVIASFSGAVSGFD